MINVLPINKIFLAGFAFVLTHWKKIGEISILPLIVSLPFLLIFSDLLALITPILNGEKMPEIPLPDNTLIYLILFSYGYFMLSINMYRLVLGISVNGWLPIVNLRQILRFMGLHLLIGVATMLPVILTGIGVLQLVMYFLIAPIMLNFVNIAISQPLKYRWNLSFITHSNLFFLQVILPALVGLLFSFLGDMLGFSFLGAAVKIIVFYWTLVTLGLCYQLIENNHVDSET